MERQTFKCMRGVDLWHAVEFRELLVQVEFGHLAAKDPQRSIRMCLSMCVNVCACASMCTHEHVCVKFRLS